MFTCILYLPNGNLFIIEVISKEAAVAKYAFAASIPEALSAAFLASSKAASAAAE